MLKAANPTVFPRYSHLPIIPVITTGLNRLPQASYTAMVGTTCCDNILTFLPPVPAKRRTGFEVTRADPSWSLKEVMANLLGPRSTPQVETCTKARQCIGSRVRSLVVLDRLPPTLLLHLPEPITQKEDQVWRLFEPMELAYRTTRGMIRVRYQPVGCVVMISWDHFVVRWRNEKDGSSQILQYDGLESPNASKRPSWWEENDSKQERPRKSGAKKASNGSGVVTMFYQQYESM